MNNYLIYHIFILSILFSACNNKIKVSGNELVLSEEMETIKIENLSNDEHIDISPYLDTVKYVKLELTDDSMIGYMQKLAVYKDRIYILDTQASSLFIFDINGKYLFKIANIGYGPGEYSQLDFFDIDYDNEQIVLTDLMVNRVLRYDLNGNFISQKNIPFWNVGVAPGADKGFIVYANFRNNKDKLDMEYNFMFLDSLTNITKGYMPYNSSALKTRLTRLLTPMTSVFYPYAGQFSFFTAFGNNIYRIGKDDLQLRYSFDFGDKSVDLNLVENEEEFKSYFDGVYYTIHRIQETDELLSFSLSASDFPIITQGFYSKESKRTLFSNIYIMKEEGQFEQFDILAIAAYDSWIIADLNPTNLISWRERTENISFKNKWLQQKKEFVQDLDLEDNPVLMFYKLKDF